MYQLDSASRKLRVSSQAAAMFNASSSVVIDRTNSSVLAKM